MKFEVLLGILFMLLSKKRVSATEICDRFGLCRRTVYRYMDVLSICVPIYVLRGKYGGYSISDSYRLPAAFLTEKEFFVTVQALDMLRGELPGKEVVSAMEKLYASNKAGKDFNLSGGNVIIDSGPWGITDEHNNKLRVLGECVENRSLVSIIYRDSDGQETERLIEPHLLVLKQGLWYTYAFCRMRGEFRLFKVGRIDSLAVKPANFDRRDATGIEDVLKYQVKGEESEDVVLKIENSAVSEAEEWLGVECVKRGDGVAVARACLPVNAGLVSKILSFGGRVQVVSPATLKNSVIKAAQNVIKSYA